ncbi:WRKY DNA-binding protein 32 [Wolffia australiana]
MAEDPSLGDSEQKRDNGGLDEKQPSPAKTTSPPRKNLEDASGAVNGASPDPGSKGAPVKTSAFETLAIPIPFAPNSGFASDGSHAFIDCRSFSQLLAGAMASPVGNSRSAQILALPLEGMRLPLVAVPCIIAPASLLESPGFAGQFAMTHQAVLATVTAHAQMQLQTAYTTTSLISTATPVPLQQVPPTASQENGVSTVVEGSPADQKLQNDIATSKTPSTDGFNWRKYGQKQVKSGENSRSYYKCTHANCFAKKKVERCHGGHVVEIIYRGDHSHDPPPKPKSQKEKGPVTNFSEEGDQLKLALMDSNGSLENASKMSPRRSSDRNSSQKIKQSKERKPSSDASFGDNEVIMTPASEDVKDSETSPSKALENSSPSTSERQLALPSERESDASIKIEEGNANEPTPKRRIKEGAFSSPAPSPKIVKEQRVIVQKMSDGGIVTDGYRWRKYGQKFVKGNPNPRSYYRCTHIGCPVRKHVEKDSADPMTLIITYEAEHNHIQPPPKNDGDTPVLLIAAAAAAAAAAATPNPAAKLEPQPDIEHGGDQTLESAQTLLSMGLSPGDEDGHAVPEEESAAMAAATESDNMQRPTFDENLASVSIHNS